MRESTWTAVIESADKLALKLAALQNDAPHLQVKNVFQYGPDKFIIVFAMPG